MPKLSILIPIYNVEPYLDQALNSVVSQTLKDLEIICINDGSTDNSLNIIKSYAQKDPRILIIDKPNSGYGDSMNQGLKLAQGEYIGILEPDDWIEPSAFATLYHLATKFHADVVRGNYYHFSAKKDQKQSVIHPDEVGRVICPRSQTHILYQAPAIWSAIYRRQFLLDHDITFLPTPGASYQDTGFNFKALLAADRVVFTDEAFLHYRVDNASSSVKDINKVYNICNEYASIEEFLQKDDRYKTMIPLMQAIKFGAYYWNLQRLTGKNLRLFLERTKQDFSSVPLEQQYFLDPLQWKLLNTILHRNLSAALLMLKTAQTKSQLKSSLRPLYHKLRPAKTTRKAITNYGTTHES